MSEPPRITCTHCGFDLGPADLVRDEHGHWVWRLNVADLTRDCPARPDQEDE
jgi:hypothetical protein